MPLALRLVLTLMASLLIVSLVKIEARADEKRFVHAGIAGDAKRYEAYLKAQWQPKGGAHEGRAEGDKALAAGLRAGGRLRRQ
jgi:alpha-2-macroglobulin